MSTREKGIAIIASWNWAGRPAYRDTVTPELPLSSGRGLG
jgi:hypothetical protein